MELREASVEYVEVEVSSEEEDYVSVEGDVDRDSVGDKVQEIEPTETGSVEVSDGDCVAGTCAHAMEENFVGCESCDGSFHWSCVGLTKEEEQLLPLANSVFICARCGSGSVYVREDGKEFRYSQLSPQSKRRWKSAARKRGRSRI